jgi:hypothetical protein
VITIASVPVFNEVSEIRIRLWTIEKSSLEVK